MGEITIAALQCSFTDNLATNLAAVQALFPDRVAIGARSDHMLVTGGGSFHCISQQVPA